MTGVMPEASCATTTRYLPTWLSRQKNGRGVGGAAARKKIVVAEAGIEPAADGAYETPALPTELFRDVEDGCPSWVRTKPPEFKARCPSS